MAEEILMPELGESVHEGTVSRWLKQVGDAVKEDEPIVEIMTDKVNTELQAPATGYLIKILIPEGENVRVFEPLGLIGAEKEAAASSAPKPAPTPAPPIEHAATPTPISTAPPPAGATNGDRRRWYTPVVRSIAKQNSLSDAQLATIAGTGEGGRVTKRDVEAFLGTGPVAARRPPAKPTEPAVTTPLVAGPDQEIIALTGMRKAIADAMTRANATPSVSTIAEVDVSRLVEFRKINKDSFQANYGVKLTYTPFFIKAITESLIQFPTVNSSVTDDGKLMLNRAVHMGVAVALGDGSQGLVVPVIKDAHKKTLIEIAKALEDIAKRARESKLELSDLQGATSTITNPGTYGALFGTPMIPPGQGSIIGTYAIKETPVVVDGMIAIRPIMHLVLSYDHRIIDGMLAGAFLKSVRDRLESFDFFR
jgi:pyruvate/2-oxoglutarate dehydrogenase complex dihydrolipoamide acyltransferase (E2) component